MYFDVYFIFKSIFIPFLVNIMKVINNVFRVKMHYHPLLSYLPRHTFFVTFFMRQLRKILNTFFSQIHQSRKLFPTDEIASFFMFFIRLLSIEKYNFLVRDDYSLLIHFCDTLFPKKKIGLYNKNHGAFY